MFSSKDLKWIFSIKKKKKHWVHSGNGYGKRDFYILYKYICMCGTIFYKQNCGICTSTTGIKTLIGLWYCIVLGNQVNRINHGGS